MSYMTGESRSMVEQFLAEGNSLGSVAAIDRPARTVDAFLVLEREMKLMKEGVRGE